MTGFLKPEKRFWNIFREDPVGRNEAFQNKIEGCLM